MSLLISHGQRGLRAHAVEAMLQRVNGAAAGPQLPLIYGAPHHAGFGHVLRDTTEKVAASLVFVRACHVGVAGGPSNHGAAKPAVKNQGMAQRILLEPGAFTQNPNGQKIDMIAAVKFVVKTLVADEFLRTQYYKTFHKDQYDSKFFNAAVKN